jgi:2-polyprenyl-6-methoxyphenol hydroxylase-like FAD-dependent oxidoreductase
MFDVEIIIIGAGPSGIALAHTLKHRLGFNDFTVSLLDFTGSEGQRLLEIIIWSEITKVFVLDI